MVHRLKSGKIIDVQITSHELKYNGRKSIFEASREITDQKLAEETLKKSETLYQDLVETSHDLIWQCDVEGRYTYLNPAWEEVFGYNFTCKCCTLVSK